MHKHSSKTLTIVISIIIVLGLFIGIGHHLSNHTTLFTNLSTTLPAHNWKLISGSHTTNANFTHHSMSVDSDSANINIYHHILIINAGNGVHMTYKLVHKDGSTLSLKLAQAEVNHHNLIRGHHLEIAGHSYGSTTSANWTLIQE